MIFQTDLVRSFQKIKVRVWRSGGARLHDTTAALEFSRAATKTSPWRVSDGRTPTSASHGVVMIPQENSRAVAASCSLATVCYVVAVVVYSRPLGILCRRSALQSSANRRHPRCCHDLPRNPQGRMQSSADGRQPRRCHDLPRKFHSFGG